MSIPVTVADINAFTNKWIVPRTTDVVYKESPLFTRMINKQNVRFEGGHSIQRPIMYAKLTGGAYSKGDTFNVAYVQTDAAFAVSLKSYYVNITLYGLDDVLNRGREAAFSTVETKMANASMRMAELLAKAFWGDGQTSADDVTTSAGLLTGTKELDGLLAWIDDGNTVGTTTYTAATDLTKSFTAIGGLTRNDLFASAPTFTGATTPAAAMGGANAYCDRTFTNFTLAEINKAIGKATYGNKFPDLLCGDQVVWDKFWNAVQPNQRFQEESSDLAKIGFQSLRFNKSSLVVDQYAPAGLLLGLNTNFIEFYVTTNPKYQFGFTGFKEAQNSDNLSGQYLFAGNLVVASPRTSFKLTGTGLQ